MIPVTSFAGKKVAVFGLGASGRATALALAAGGALVTAADDSTDARDAAKSAGIPVADLRIADWRSFSALVLAPGVPLTHPQPHWTVVSAHAAGIEVIGDIELFCRERRRHVPQAPFVAVTGTNGKSTTTALIAHMLSAAGRDVALGGNIGTPILALPPPKMGRTHVIECSSFQIDLAPTLDPSVGVLLNITPDHLDRHGTMDAYARLKERLVAGAASAVIAVDDNRCQSIADRIARAGIPVTRVSARQPVAHGVYSEGGGGVFFAEGGAIRIADLTGIPSLRGAHNAQNAVAAIAAARLQGLTPEEIRRGLATFPGLPHRMEEVSRRGNVLFVNDSKATNADATAKALAIFRAYLLDRRRAREGGRHREPRGILPAHRQGLSDRRGGRRLCHNHRRRGPGGEVRDYRNRRRRRRRRCRRRSRAGERSAALASVCVLRPVPEFRAPWRCVPHAGARSRAKGGGRLMVSRVDRSRFAEWWWTVDRVLLGAVGALIVAGIVLSLAASPAVAERIGYGSFYFVQRQVLFMVPAVIVLIATSFLSPRQARHVALIVLLVAIVLMLAALFVGTEVKGSRRWIDFAGFSLQPSEFMKPAFVVVVAWLFAENARRTDIPGNAFALILLAMVVSLLVAEPDFGQTMLIVISWSALFFLAGLSWPWILGIAVLAGGGIFAAYETFPHVAARIDRFVAPTSGDTFQIDKALASITRGGWFGQGPGEGIIKRVIPDAHTDFIFAVAAEEFGILACIGLVAVFAIIVFRGLSRSSRTDDPFVRLAGAGLVVLFGVQSAINMAVNLDLMPSKGMTLPFISYGGSSMVAVAFGMGLVLALTRRRAEPRTVPGQCSRARARRRDAQSCLKQRMRGPVLLAAGGTGGHLLPGRSAGRSRLSRAAVARPSRHRPPR